MIIDFSPLRRHRDFRFLFFGQFVSLFGTMMTRVGLPYQVYQLTHSSFAVGMLGIVELVPLLLTAFVGGAFADSMDRRKLVVFSEIGMAVCSATLALNAFSGHPQIWILFLMAGMMTALNGFHRPALEAMTPRLVSRDEIPAVGALSSMKGSIGMIGGPAVGGILLARYGLPVTYLADVVTFVLSVLALMLMKRMPPSEKARPPSVKSVLEGLHYAKSRQELMGTYIVDIIAMVFGMPMALFPAVAETLGGASVLGWLYSAPAVGALVASLMSGWIRKSNRHGAGVVVAAAIWGVAITVFGFMTHIWLALFFLGLAGAADMVSGVYRSTIWNQTIPDRLRGRLAGVEMVSYMTGPLLGNAEAGLAASLFGLQASIVSGGFLCVIGVGICSLWLPKFWKYDSSRFVHEPTRTESESVALS